VVRETVCDAGYRDVHLSVITAAHSPAELPRIEANVAACHEMCLEINREVIGN
jgi:hypothetical protein